jgi:hypothetical protein
MDQRDLIKCVRQYRQYDDALKQLNSKANEIREKRKIVELEMGDILKRPDFSHVFKLEIADDKSAIKIQRPDTWSKPWNMSVRDLSVLVQEYFQQPGIKDADTCLAYIIKRRKEDLVAKDFSFSRIIPLEDNESS